MAPTGFNAEVLLTAFGVYALIVIALTLWNARAARLESRGLDEPRPGGHVLDKRRAQALVGQIFGGHR